MFKKFFMIGLLSFSNYAFTLGCSDLSSELARLEFFVSRISSNIESDIQQTNLAWQHYRATFSSYEGHSVNIHHGYADQHFWPWQNFTSKLIQASRKLRGDSQRKFNNFSTLLSKCIKQEISND